MAHGPKGARWALESTVIFMAKYTVYLLQSLSRPSQFYVGVTHDLAARLKKHNQGSSRSTKPYRPWKVIYQEKYRNKKEAYKREYYLKKPQGYLEKKKITEENRVK